jgi:molybdate transport system ATP-binding protein
VSQLSFRAAHSYPGGFRLDLSFRTTRLVTAIFGPSGSGKTTILEILAGLKHPREGFVQLADRVLVDTASGLFVPVQQRGVGMVFQDQLLFPHYSVQGNLRFGERRRRRSLNGRVTFERVVEVLELNGLLARHPRNLSGGERQRVALGRALLSSPDLLLLDEPLTGLDEELKTRVLDYIRRAIREWRIPTLLVAHDFFEVKRLADWVISIRDGGLEREGPAEEFKV